MKCRCKKKTGFISTANYFAEFCIRVPTVLQTEAETDNYVTCISMRCLRSSSKLCSSSDSKTLPYNPDTTAEATWCICSTPPDVSTASKHVATAFGLSRSMRRKRPIFVSWYVRRRYPSVTAAISSTFTRWQQTAGVVSSLASISWLRAFFCWRAIHAEWNSLSAPVPIEACRASNCSRSEAIYRRSCFRWRDSSTKSATLVIDITRAQQDWNKTPENITKRQTIKNMMLRKLQR